jgi:tetratricopeptide (TPR) repeat protein
MRGRIRSLQVRLDEASDHFERARGASRSAPRSIPNLIRQLISSIYCFENWLLQESFPVVRHVPELWFPKFPESASKEIPEIQLVDNLRRCADALVHLHSGQWDVSAEIYRQLIDESRGGPPDVLAMHYLGLGASLENLGEHELALRQFENAGLSIQLGGVMLNRARVAANLHTSYLCLSETNQAGDWKAFLDRLICPQATKDALLRRSHLAVELWARNSRLLLV